MRLSEKNRRELSQLKDMPIYLGAAGYVPLSQVVKISFAAEDGLIKHFKLQPSILVQANILSGTANDATQKAFDATKNLRENLPAGFSISVDGSFKDSKTSLGYLVQPCPQ